MTERLADCFGCDRRGPPISQAVAEGWKACCPGEGHTDDMCPDCLKMFEDDGVGNLEAKHGH